MNVRVYSSPADFGAVTRWVYRRNPVRYTLELTTLRTASWPEGRILAAVTAGDAIGAVVQGKGGCLFVSGLPVKLAAEAAAALAPARIPSVRGSRAAAMEFTNAWCGITDGRAVPTREDVLYRLADPLPPRGVAGTQRLALDGDHHFVIDWLTGFLIDAQGDAPEHADGAGLLREIVGAGGRIVLWTVDGVPVSLARVHAPAVGTSRIGPVYTPPEHRGHGYAAAVTAAAVDHAKRAGAGEVVLFADADNPVSNRVYRRIGFVPVTEHVEFDLIPSKATTGDDGCELRSSSSSAGAR